MLRRIVYVFKFLILCNIKVILNDPVLRIFLLIIFSLYFCFWNWRRKLWHRIRHRSKFVIIMILLLHPYLKQFVFFKKCTPNIQKIIK